MLERSAASASTGEKLAQYTLDAPPTWDGLAAAGGKLYLSTKHGKIICFVHNQYEIDQQVVLPN